MNPTFGLWMAAIGTIVCYSYLYKDNFAFQVMEHLFIGIAAAHAVAFGFNNIRTMAWIPVVRDQKWLWLVPLVLGVLLYTRFTKNLKWLSRWPIAFMLGVGAAVTITGVVDAQFIRQIRGTMIPIRHINDVIIIVGVLGTVTYFLFGPISSRKPVRIASRVGMWTMMAAFGAAYGNTVMARMSLVIGRLQFLLADWLQILQ